MIDRILHMHNTAKHSGLSSYQLGVCVMVFMDRRDAGQQLAVKLIGYKNKNPFVLGIPRGGVVVAA